MEVFKQLVFVSASRKRRDIKIQFCLSVPVWKSLVKEVTTMDARKNVVSLFYTWNCLFEQISSQKLKLLV